MEGRRGLVVAEGQHRHAGGVALIRLEVRAKASRKKKRCVAGHERVLEESKLTRAEAGALVRNAGAPTNVHSGLEEDAGRIEVEIGRTPEMTQREQEFGLCAMQLLQVATWVTRKQSRKESRRNRNVSVAQSPAGMEKSRARFSGGKNDDVFKARLITCVEDEYIRKSNKVRRAWPERKDHESPQAPILRRLVKRLKTKGTIKLDECKCRAG